jgi:hypothetical protein
MAAINALFSLLLILLVGVLIYGPWQKVCTAFARQIMYEKRDAIFDLAREGKLSFNSREYRTIRVLLERTIRFAHEATLPSFFVFWGMLTLRREKIKKPELQVAIENISDPETRKLVQVLVYDAIDTLLIMTIFKSPIAVGIIVVLLLPLAALVLIASMVGAVRKVIKAARARSREILQFEAEQVGSVTDAIPV